jgi:transcriptional regulator with XRE-family HTH domain
MMENPAAVSDERDRHTPPPPEKEAADLWDGRWLRDLRLARGIRAKDLAERAGVSSSNLYDIEFNRQASPGIVTLRKIVRGLGVPIEALFEDSDVDDEAHFRAGYTAALIDMQDKLYELRQEHEPRVE